MDIKIRICMTMFACVFFAFCTMAGISIRTVEDMRLEKGILAAHLVAIPMRELQEQRI